MASRQRPVPRHLTFLPLTTEKGITDSTVNRVMVGPNLHGSVTEEIELGSVGNERCFAGEKKADQGSSFGG